MWPFRKTVDVWRQCPACMGSGQQRPISLRAKGIPAVDALVLLQGICSACGGQGGRYHRILADSPDAQENRDA